MSKKLTIEFLKEKFLDRGYILTSYLYKDNKQKLKYKCPKGHEGTISWNSFSRGHGCAVCYGNSTLNIKYVKEKFRVDGCKVLSKNYVNSYTPIKYKCVNGHVQTTNLSKFKQGHRCVECAGHRKYTYKEVKDYFRSFGYCLISATYKNNKTKLEYKCSEGHRGSISLHSFLTGQRCGRCYGNKKFEYGEVFSIFASKGFLLLEKNYINSQTLMQYLCPNKHKNKIRLSNFKVGWGCPDCSGNKKKTIEFVSKRFSLEGHVLISEEYHNSVTKLECRCPKGHEWFVTWGDFNHGYRCGTCFRLGRSKSEKEITTFIKSFYSGEVLENSRKIIPPFELDIYIPSKRLAIEYNGLYWHSEAQDKDNIYHYNKTKLCAEKGIRIITSFEDEFLAGKEEVFKKLKSVLEDPKTLLYVVKGSILVSNSCWDIFNPDECYRDLGYNFLYKSGPILYYVDGVKRVKKEIKKDMGKIWDCGMRVYTKGV